MDERVGTELTELDKKALSTYEDRLKALLDPAHTGEAVAIHVDSGDYALGRSHTKALHALLARHEADGRVVTLTIGPPTDSDRQLLARLGGKA
jgi:hypothetical protein